LLKKRPIGDELLFADSPLAAGLSLGELAGGAAGLV
jgi:hypothetical protein